MGNMPQNVQDAYVKARLYLMSKNRYLASAVYRVSVAYSEKCPTACISKDWVMYLGPSVSALSPKQLAWVIRHEIWHVLRRHWGRCQTQKADPKLWNMCADAEINDDDLDGMELPKFKMENGEDFKAVFPESLGQSDGLIAEEYYHNLMKNAKVCKICALAGSGSDGERKEWEEGGGAGGKDEGEAPTQVEMDAITRAVAQAIISDGFGKNHGDLLRWANKVVKPSRTPWQKVLAQYCQRGVRIGGQVDYTFTRPSRRWRKDMIRPAMFATKPHVALVWDSSGSMGDEDHTTCSGETMKIMKLIGGCRIISSDTEVHDSGFVSDPRKVKIVGGGGTDMMVPINYCCKLKDRPNLIVVLTDGDSPWDESPPSIPTVVVLTRETHTQIPAWAKIIKAFKNDD